jgi:hypothetical protein
MNASQGEKTEKITINLGLVDLGQIDLLVQEGFYTNRTTRQWPGARLLSAAVTTPAAIWKRSATPGR